MAEVRENPIFNVIPPVKSYIGRTGELINLHKRLQKPQKPMVVSQCVAITGLGGVGKSELARKYAWEYHNYYYHIIWINCETKLHTLKSFKKLAEDLKILGNSYMTKEPLENILLSIVPKMYTRLAKDKTLLVFDNVDQLEDIKNFIPQKLTLADEKPAVIITSRHSGWDIGDNGNIDVILLSQFTPDEATSYVKESLQITNGDKSHDDLITKLIETLCYFPLALHQAVCCINTKSSLSEGIQEYLKEFGDERKKGNLLKKKPKHDRYSETTYTTWQGTFENIRNKGTDGKLAIQLVEIMSYLTPDDISLEMFIEIEKDEEKLKEAIDMLVKYSIITVQDGKVCINELVQLVVRLGLKNNQREEEVLTNVLTQVYNYLDEYRMREIWRYACNYTTLIDDYFCKTYEESNDHRAFIQALHYLVNDGNVLLIKQIIDHLESKSDLWHKLCSEMFHESWVKCNHNDPTTEDTFHETHIKYIYLFHAEVHKALKTSKTKDLQEFLQGFDKSLINSYFDKKMALQKSIESGNLDVVKVLIENGADINFGDIDNHCPLIVAFQAKHPEIAEYLLDQGADIADTWGKKPIHYAAKYGHVNIMQRLADTKEARESSTKKLWTPLHFAAENDQLEIVKFLISIEVDVTAMTEDGQTACHIAVEKGNIHIIRYLISNKLVDVNLRNGKNETLLHIATRCGNFDIVKYLLPVASRVKEDINAFDDWGATPLLLAVAKGNIEIIRYFIDHGASVDNVQNGTTLLGKLKLSALHLAAALNNFEIAKILVEKLKADINMGLDTSASPLQIAKIFNSTDVRQFLLEKGADESAKDNSENIRRIFLSFIGDRANIDHYLDNVRYLLDGWLSSYNSSKSACVNFFFNHLKSDIRRHLIDI